MMAIALRQEHDAKAIAVEPATTKTKQRKTKVKTPDRPIGDRILLEFAGLPPIVVSRDTAIERLRNFKVSLTSCQEITIYLDNDPDDRTTVKPANLNRNRTAFESGTFGDRENAIASNKRDSVALTPKIPHVLTNDIVRSIFLDGVCVYGTIGKLSPVDRIEKQSRSECGTKRRANRVKQKTIAAIPFNAIADRRSLTDKKLGKITAWIDSRSKRLMIETATDQYYAYIGITPIRSVVWQCTDPRYKDLTAYYNTRSGYYVPEKSIDRNDTPTQRAVNNHAPIPQCLHGFKIEIERDRLMARSPDRAITIATLQNMDMGHSVMIDRRLHSTDGTIADLNVDDNFWGSLTKMINGVYGTIANSDRRYATKQKNTLKAIQKTIAIVDGSNSLLTTIEQKAIADRFAFYANLAGFNTLGSIVILCSQARDPNNEDHDRAIAIFRDILKSSKK